MDLSLIVTNIGRLWTGADISTIDPRITSIGVKDRRIVLFGNDADVLAQRGPRTRVVDALGGLVTPGFTDSHCHFLDGGQRLLSVALRDVTTKEMFATRLAAFVRNVPEGTWVLGGDWDHQKWGGILPDRTWIDAVAPNHPVWLNRMDGHMAVANSAALALAGLGRHTLDVAGGEILRDSRGELTGLLKDNAMNLVTAHLPPHTPERLDQALEAAMDYVAAKGICSVHTMVTVDCADGLWPKPQNAGNEDFSAAYAELATYRRAHRSGRLRTRIDAALPLNSLSLLKSEIAQYGRGDAWLRTDSVKAMIDGSLGTHTAAMYDDYDDTPGYRGYLIWEIERLEALVREADAAGFQVKMHAIGDRGINEMLNIFERLNTSVPLRDRRLRCEHAQHFAPADIQRFAALGIIASVQPSHLADDGRWACKCLGIKRLKTSWPLRSLLNHGTVLALGSDWFVTPPHPMEGIHAAVTRKTLDGQYPEGLIPEERISTEEALRGYTLDAAYAGFAEKDLGSLSIGKYADIVVLDTDILAAPTEALHHAKVTTTIIDGQVVYDRNNA